MFLASALNKNRALPTFKDKTIWIYPSGYGLFPDVQKDCYPFGFKRSQLGTRPTRNELQILFEFGPCRDKVVTL